jgi:hypothetical protein
MTEDGLDVMLADAREQIAADLEDERGWVTPDFAAMIAAAHQHDPERVPIEWLHEAEALAPVVDLRAREPEFARIGDEQLDALIGEARLAAERDIADRRLAAIPAFAVPQPLVRSRRWVMRLAIAAAFVGVAVAGARLLERSFDAARNGAATKNQAEFQDRLRGGNEAEPVPRMERVDRGGETGEAVRMPAIPEDVPLVDGDARARTRSRPDRADQTDRTDRILALDAEAQRLWAAGELEAAQEVFRALLELAGHSRHADLAYGDLFTLTHQRKDDAAELALWREYLREFPRGRFADDARAGVCRRGPADERASCWQAYLDDFPTGVHRRTAERALDTSDSP